jgi:trans-L-3-hydroxyproline dehydratase
MTSPGADSFGRKKAQKRQKKPELCALASFGVRCAFWRLCFFMSHSRYIMTAAKLTTIDAHTAGEPLRIITSGWPEPLGATILEKRRYAREQQDHLRRFLMFEPRGHADMYGCLLTAPATPDGDVGVLFMHNEGFSTMCGHGIIGLVKVGLEYGLFQARDAEIRIDTPAGRVTAQAHRNADGTIERVSFRNVASFLLEKDLRVEVAGLGAVTCDIAFGGAFYAYVEAPAIGLSLTPENYARIIHTGKTIKRAVMDSYDIRHPAGDTDLNFLYGVIFVEKLHTGAHSRNVCVFAEGEVDRSPTGTGVSGRAAIHYARGELQLGQTITIESILGTAFEVTALEETRVGAITAIIPQVSGAAHITGRHEFFLDPRDPLNTGFLLR